MPDIAHRGWPRDLDLIHRIRLQVRELIHARLSSGKCLTEMRNSNEHAYQVSTIASACTRLQRSARIPTCTDPLAQAFASAHNSSRPGEAAHRLAPTRINRPRQRRFAIHLLAHHNSTRLPLAQHRMCKSAACIEATAFPLRLPPKSLEEKKKIHLLPRRSRPRAQTPVSGSLSKLQWLQFYLFVCTLCLCDLFGAALKSIHLAFTPPVQFCRFAALLHIRCVSKNLDLFQRSILPVHRRGRLADPGFIPLYVRPGVFKTAHRIIGFRALRCEMKGRGQG